MKIYNYDKISGIYLSEAEAQKNPLVEGEYLIPAFATTVTPPTVLENQVAVFSNGTWSVIADYRGITYWTDYQTSVEITELGVTVPADAYTEQPDKPADVVEAETQANFRAERNALLLEADYKINALEDTGEDASAWRTYRQALRDSTETWTLPDKPTE